MSYKYFSIAVIFFAALLLSSCGPALYIPEVRDGMNGASLNQLLKGRELYSEKCGSCHSVYLPEKYTIQEWTSRINEMSGRAKISREESTLILNYVSVKARR